MKNSEEIKSLILDKNIQDEEVKNEMKKPNLTISEEEGNELLILLRKERPNLFMDW
jgi:hypothetical protein